MRSGPKPKEIRLTAREVYLLRKIADARRTNQGFAQRASIILLAGQRKSNVRIAKLTKTSRTTVILWRDRYADAYSRIHILIQKDISDSELKAFIQAILKDEPRIGAPCHISTEQKIALIGIACEALPQPFVAQSTWDANAIVIEAKRRGIIADISPNYVSRLLEKADVKPHRSQYWLNCGVDTKDEVLFQKPVQTICALYKAALPLHSEGVHLISVDEKTGIQAIERLAPTLRTRPGQIERIESDYMRHGTLCLIANLEIATGQINSSTIGETRTETDFVNHIKQTITADPTGQWIFVLDNLNTHLSEGLVHFVAEKCHIPMPLGIKGKNGILKSKTSRMTFLQDPTHHIRFVYTPLHCSWLNQIEIWFGVLSRKVIKRGNFISKEDLKGQISAYITQYNQNYAHPYRWTWAGVPLVAN